MTSSNSITLGRMASARAIAPAAAGPPESCAGVVISAKLTRDASSRRHAGRVRRSREWRGGIARIGTRLLFSWKKELMPESMLGPTFLRVTLANMPERPAERPASVTVPAPVIIERSAPEIAVELVGGRRVSFERDTDPETVRRLVALLEGEAR